MTVINRRHFLQGAAGALGAIALSPLTLQRRAHRYGRVLAQPTQRKVALLIGINDYPIGDDLYGPVNDVELQRQLLIHRFGFSPSDIHVLTDAAATRENIIGAYHEYLLNAVREDDVVVMHYSGHGARVAEYELMQNLLDEADRDCIDLETCQNTCLVPVDYGEGDRPVQGIMGHTLLLMRAALPTDNVTLVLDCCYSGGGKRGNVIMRSINLDLVERSFRGDLMPPQSLPAVTPDESTYQQELLTRLQWNAEDFIRVIQSVATRGLEPVQSFVAASSQAHQQSADYPFNGFTAGAFTYLLTQYLWHDNPSLAVTIPTVASSTTSLSKYSQIPEYDPEDEPRVATLPIYHLAAVAPPAEAVLIPPEGHKDSESVVKLWLGGLDPLSLDAFNRDAEFTQVNQRGEAMGTLKLLRREGLVGSGEWLEQRTSRSDAAPSPFLQERIRGVPERITLRVGLDETLSTEEQALARDRLQNLGFIEWTTVNQQQLHPPPHVLLGRYTAAIDRRMQLSGVDRRPAINSLGLFSATQEPLLIESFGIAGEALETALDRRLQAPLSSLLIGRMLALLVNQQTSQLNVSLMVEHGDTRSRQTTRGGDAADIIVPQLTKQGIQSIRLGDEVTITIANNEAYDLHIGLLVIDAAGELRVLFPPSTDDINADIVRGGTQQPLPKLRSTEPLGITKLLVIASPQPLRTALRTLQRIAPEVRNRGEGAAPADVMRDMFSPLDSRRGGGESASPPGARLLDVNQVAALSLLFDIVPAT